MLLRWGLDDSVVAVVAASIDALHALLWNPLDEVSGFIPVACQCAPQKS